MKNRLLLLTFLLLLTTMASAQIYKEVFENGWGQGLYNSKSFFIDLDNNGLLDMIVGEYHGRLFHYEQDSPASATFNLKLDEITGMDKGAQSAPCLIDLDNDGLLDMMVGTVSGSILHYEQNESGSTNFTLIADSLGGIVVGRYPAPSFTDLDNDGLLDLIIGDVTGVLHHYEQDADGSTGFTFISNKFNEIDVGIQSAPFFTDLDNDDLLDLLVGEGLGDINHYEQDEIGSEHFTLISENFNDIDIGRNSAPCITDIDGDELLDLLVGGENGNFTFYEQDAAGSTTFNLVTEKFLDILDVGIASSPFITDIDGDGLLDMIIGETGGTLSHYKQDAVGSIYFSPVSDTLSGIVVGVSAAPTFTDLDSDGLLDLIIGDYSGILHYYEQDAAGLTSFTRVADSLNGVRVPESSAPCFTDLDADGLLDLIVGEYEGNLNFYEQQTPGSADFTTVANNLDGIDFGSYAAPCINDLDGDGLLDLIVGSWIGDFEHYEQTAAGSHDFTFITNSFSDYDVGYYSRPFFIDLNGDGLVDFLSGDNNGGMHYYRRLDNTKIDKDLKNPLTCKLYQNYPNPFNSNTVIQYEMSQPAKVLISIYNELGQRVRLLKDNYQQAGSYTVLWDGKDELGNPLASGIYICLLNTGTFKQSTKLLYLK
ncbi:VCBS repeat-containing protein [candidate division KSB1 bacterium]|nr:VCBS repeat-containing protein [candidate division KSB1 bacterium]